MVRVGQGATAADGHQARVAGVGEDHSGEVNQALDPSLPRHGVRLLASLGILRAMPPKVRDIIAELEAAGWQLVEQEGSHRQFRHPVHPGKVTVAGGLGRDVIPGTLASIRRQAGLPRLGR